MVKNILFDLGRVLLSFEPERYLDSIYDKEISGILKKNVFSSSVWLDLDRGIISVSEAERIITEKIPQYSSEVRYLLKNWTEILTPCEKMTNLLKELKEKGYHIFLITNFHKEAFYEMHEKFDFFRFFEGYVLSSEVHMLKPEKGIFIKSCECFSIIPEETIFIDDSYPNISAAEDMGFKTIHHTSEEETIVSVNNILGI